MYTQNYEYYWNIDILTEKLHNPVLLKISACEYERMKQVEKINLAKQEWKGKKCNGNSVCLVVKKI